MNFKDTKWSDDPPVNAQRDWYNGTEYRSKLESKTAQALDIIGIEYVYEPRGYKLSNGMWYRPDFWLPEAKQFIECKGVMDEVDSAKIVGLVHDEGAPVLVVSYTNSMLVMRAWDDGSKEIVTYSGDEVALSTCAVCGKRWFMAWPDTYTCPCCGAYDGDHHLANVETVRSATELFNYGQKLAADKPIYRDLADSFNN